MNARAGFNTAMDWLLARPIWQLKVAALIASVALAASCIARHDAGLRESGAQDVRDSLAASTALRWHHTVDTLSRQADTQTVTLTRILRRTDTLLRQVPETIVTHEDTVRAIQGLPALRASTDSAIRACSDYQALFFRYRTACDSLHYADRAQIDGLKRELAKTHPSGWHRVLTWAEIGAAGYVGYRVGRGR